MKEVYYKEDKIHLRNLFIFLFCLLFVSCDSKSDKNFSFAYIGDLHYSLTDSLSTDYLIQSVAGELDNLKNKPELIIQTGDFFHGGRGIDIAAEASMAFKHFVRDIGMPFYIAKGNHDSRGPYEKNALPIFSRELGNDDLKSYFSFDRAGCHFILLDCTEEILDDQLLWLEDDLKAVKSDPKIKHIFVARQIF